MPIPQEIVEYFFTWKSLKVETYDPMRFKSDNFPTDNLCRDAKFRVSTRMLPEKPDTERY